MGEAARSPSDVTGRKKERAALEHKKRGGGSHPASSQKKKMGDKRTEREIAESDVEARGKGPPSGKICEGVLKGKEEAIMAWVGSREGRIGVARGQKKRN